MATRGLCALAVLAFGLCAAAEEPKKADALKKELVGKWETANRDKIPVEFGADGTIKVGFVQKDGTWVMAEGTFTVDAAGEIKYRARSGGATLGGWYKYKDGVLTNARGSGPNPIVTWKKVEEKK
jgi:uncharacterized protein (TIGR03066 family)